MIQVIKSNIVLKVLLCFFFYLVISYLRGVNFFSLSIEKVLKPISLGNYRGDPLLQGDKVNIKYTSEYPKLGTIKIRFTTFYRINSDSLKFNLKNSNDENWYYTNTYKVDQFQDKEFFPFGFPLIEKSEGEIYNIEIESISGSLSDSVAITSPLNYSVIAKHVFTQSQLFSSPKLLAYFIFHKILFLVSDPEYLTHLLAYSIPLIYYFLYSLFGLSVGMFSGIIFLSTILDTVFVSGYNSFLLISIIVSWSYMVWSHRVESKVTTSVSLFYMFLAIILFSVMQPELGDKVAVWAYFFLVSSVVQLVHHQISNQRAEVSLADYHRSLIIENKNALLVLFLVLVGEIKVAVEYLRGKSLNMKAESKKSMESIVLTVFRKELPIKRLYFNTSRKLSRFIVALVIFFNYLIYISPYAILCGISWSVVHQVRGYFVFFQEFFLQDQAGYFWNQLGKGFVIIGSLILLSVVYLFFFKKLSLRRKILAVSAILFVCKIFLRVIFNISTPYRDRVVTMMVSPSQTSEAWVDVTVTGRNFQESPFIGKVYIDKVEQQVIRWQKNKVVFRTNPTFTKSGDICLQTLAKRDSNCLPFEYNFEKEKRVK